MGFLGIHFRREEFGQKISWKKALLDFQSSFLNPNLKEAILGKGLKHLGRGFFKEMAYWNLATRF